MSAQHTPGAEEVQRALASLTAPQRDQVAIMGDAEVAWSATHGWPSLCEALRSKGIVEITGQSMWGNKPEYRSVPTALGIAVRAAIRKARGAA